MGSFLLEFVSFLRARKKFWLLPILVVILAVGALLLIAQSSVIAPFIYTIF
jgi:competence protein ComGC